MTFSLEHFDLHFPPALVTSGEKLYDNGAIILSEEIEKNLWSFEVKDGGVFEIEILITPKKVSNTSCDCETFKTEGECRHIVGSLYQLRLLKTKNINAGPRVVRSVPKKLSIPNILNQVDPEDLKSFVRNFAKKNKKFSTSLKATFARKIEIENNEEKYEGILNGVIRPATNVNHKISYQSIKQFKTIAQQFDAQFEDSISLKQFTESFYIIKSLLGKVAYVNHWTGSENEEIVSLTKHFHKQFRLLTELDIAPSLLQQMMKFGIDLAGRSYYHITHSEHNLLLILLDPPGLNNRKQKLIEILESKLKSELLHDGELEKSWIIRQYFIEKNLKLSDVAQPVLSSQSVYRIVDQLLDFKAYVGLKNFLELFKVNEQFKDLYLVKSYVKVLRKIGTKEDILKVVNQSLLFFKSVYFYDLFKKNYPESSEAFFQDISDQIKNKRSFDYQKLYLDILISDGRTSELIEYLLDSRYALRHIYDRAEYIKLNSKRLTEVLIILSDKYLSEYLGKESSNEMRKLLLFLRKKGWDFELNKLQSHLLNDYEDRKSLQTEIQDF